MIIDIIAIAILVICIYSGIKKGFVKAFFGTVSFFLALILTFAFTEAAFGYAKQSGIGTFIYEKTAVKIVDESAEEENEGFLETLIDKKGIMEKASEAQKNISEEIGDTVLKLLTAVVLFVGFTIILKILSMLLNTAAKLPLLKSFNKFGGFFAGAINAYIILTVFSCLMTFIGATALSEFVTAQMAESKAVTWFYLNNPLL